MLGYKEIFRAEIKRIIEKSISQFPYYFFGNVALNVFLLLLWIFSLAVFFIGIEAGNAEYMAYTLIFMGFISGIFRVTLLGLSRNIHIFHVLRAGHYDLEIKDYEMDHALDFVGSLPKIKQEVERIKISLSFGKIVELLELFGVICCKKDIVDLDPLLRLKYDVGVVAEEEENKIAADKKF